MKILQVIPSIDPAAGGPIEATKQVSLALSALGHQVEILCTGHRTGIAVDGAGTRIHFLGKSYTGYQYAPELVAWLEQSASRYDAVIVRGIWGYHSFGVWRALRRGPVPYFVFTHGMLDPWFKHHYPLKHLKKWLYWPWAEYRVLRDAAAVFFTCEEEKLLAPQSFWLHKWNGVVVNYGTSAPCGDPDRQQELFLSRYPQVRGKRIILFMGRIHPKKGCDILLEAFAAIARTDPTLFLVMAGPDQMGWKQELQELAAKVGVSDQLIWPGMLQGDMKWGALYASDVFALSSHQENFGIAVVEALACGVPVLISNKINIWREIELSNAGFVGADTKDGMRSLLEQWLGLSEVSKAEMRMNATRCFRERFEIGNAAESLIQAMEANLHEKSHA